VKEETACGEIFTRAVSLFFIGAGFVQEMY
jgi:hypothetical protein